MAIFDINPIPSDINDIIGINNAINSQRLVKSFD